LLQVCGEEGGMRRARERLGWLLELEGTGVLAGDLDGTVRLASRGVRRLAGLRRMDLWRGRVRLDALVPRGDGPRLRAAIARCRERRTPEVLTTSIVTSDRARPVVLVLAGVPDRARFSAVLLEAIDPAAPLDVHTALLAKTSRVLEEPCSLVSALQRIVRIPVPHVASGCLAAAIDGDGALRLSVAHELAAEEHALRDAPDLARLVEPELAEAMRASGPVVVPCRGDLAPVELAGGARVWLPLRCAGQALGALCLLARAAPRPALAEELAARAAVAVYAFRAVTEKEAAEGRRLRTLALLVHELRSPLATARLALDALRAGAASPATRDLLARLVEYMRRLSDDVLDAERARRGAISVVLRRTDPGEVIRGAVESCGALVEGRAQRLTVEVPDVPLAVLADPARLQQALVKLLENASRYTPEGGAIAVSARRVDREVELAVEDTGVGIPPERLAHLFEGDDARPCADRCRVGGDGGLGLGLPLAWRLVEAQGGAITARSEGPGRGSVFTIRLPALA
jgi:signal transduction histidine kinase